MSGEKCGPSGVEWGFRRLVFGSTNAEGANFVPGEVVGDEVAIKTSPDESETLHSPSLGETDDNLFSES